MHTTSYGGASRRSAGLSKSRLTFLALASRLPDGEVRHRPAKEPLRVGERISAVAAQSGAQLGVRRSAGLCVLGERTVARELTAIFRVQATNAPVRAHYAIEAGGLVHPPVERADVV